MRQQVHTLGQTPVPVTATDLYIHGRGGFVVDQLNCGMDIILGELRRHLRAGYAPAAGDVQDDSDRRRFLIRRLPAAAAARRRRLSARRSRPPEHGGGRPRPDSDARGGSMPR